MQAESVEEYLARGGQIKIVPRGVGTKDPAKGKHGEALRKRLAAEADAASAAQRNGGGK